MLMIRVMRMIVMTTKAIKKIIMTVIFTRLNLPVKTPCMWQSCAMTGPG